MSEADIAIIKATKQSCGVNGWGAGYDMVVRPFIEGVDVQNIDLARLGQ